MSQHDFVDCQGLAGAWTLGTTQAGFDLVHRTSLPGGFGDPIVDANRHLLGGIWEQEVGGLNDWTPWENVSYVCGTPPCSGFSLLNQAKGSNARGKDSTINSCMRELVSYGARCVGPDGIKGAPFISFESVQGAYSEGRELMQDLRDTAERESGQKYELTHVKMSGSTIGAAQFRKRYFPVFHRVPFGLEHPDPADVLPDGHCVTYYDACGDLAGGKLQWEPQPYPLEPVSEWCRSRRRLDGLFEDHVPLNYKKLESAIQELCEAGWPEGTSLDHACRILDIRPEAMERAWNEETGRYNGWSWPRRVKRDRPGYVLTGSAGGFVHWDENRSLTVRECARLMGYPDSWVWPFDRHDHCAMYIGKCCPVDSGRWISSWVLRALEGEPGTIHDAMPDGEREFLFDCTNNYKDYPGADVPPRPEGVCR